MHDGRFGEHDRVHPAPPSVLPVQVALLARDDVICVHPRRKPDQNTRKTQKDTKGQDTRVISQRTKGDNVYANAKWYLLLVCFPNLERVSKIFTRNN